MKARATLDGKLGLRRVVELFIDSETRHHWDDTLQLSRIIKRYSKNLLTRYYVISVAILLMQHRDFAEKLVVFKSKDTVYIYTSSIDNALLPVRDDMTRGRNVASCTRISRAGDNILLETMGQMDLLFPFPSFMVNPKLASGFENLRNEIVTALSKKNN